MSAKESTAERPSWVAHFFASADQQNEHDLGRREVFRDIVASSALVLPFMTSNVPVAKAAGSALDDLPPEAQRSYKQYRIPLQIAADYYLWELRDKISVIDDWGEVNEVRIDIHALLLFRSKCNF